MTYAIIAAGEGSRLAQEGVREPKPLVRIGGESMVDRLVRIFTAHGASHICIICNDRDTEVFDHLRSLFLSPHSSFLTRRSSVFSPPSSFLVLQKSTPSSMHSLFELAPFLKDRPFVLTTVDTIFREQEFGQYVDAFRRMLSRGEGDGMMGVTDYIDDERPLYVKTDEALRIRAFLDSDALPHYVSGGIYGLTPRSLLTLEGCVGRGERRMRNFQRALLADGLRLHAYPFSKILDIDHASDIEKANRFVL